MKKLATQIQRKERQKIQLSHMDEIPPSFSLSEAISPVVHKVSAEWYIEQVPGKGTS